MMWTIVATAKFVLPVFWFSARNLHVVKFAIFLIAAKPWACVLAALAWPSPRPPTHVRLPARHLAAAAGALREMPRPHEAREWPESRARRAWHCRGGESGPGIVPGKLDESLLWERIDTDEMPPEGAACRRRSGPGAAIGSRPELPVALRRSGPARPGPDHWAFPRRAPGAAEGRCTPTNAYRRRSVHPGRARTPRPWARAGCRPTTLFRRVTIDLTGFRPLARRNRRLFGRRSSRTPIGRMVDRYLAHPATANGGASTGSTRQAMPTRNGYFNADTDRPLAYRYRDYVIRSFNADKPFDRFCSEQIAGDELAGFTPDGDVTPEMVERLVATHFLRNAPTAPARATATRTSVRADRLRGARRDVQVLARPVGSDGAMRPLPRPQVRAGHAARILSTASDPLARLLPRRLAQAERAQGLIALASQRAEQRHDGSQRSD